MRIITTEQISKFHPDKYADQIADAIVDACMVQDKNARVACEVMVKDTIVVLGGEIKTSAKVDYTDVVLTVANKLGYNVTKVTNLLGVQSQEINDAVDTDTGLKAGDQGIMFGYACRDTYKLLPIGLAVANATIKTIETDVDKNPHTILRGDAKCQVAVDDDTKQVQKVLISVCSKKGYSLEEVKDYVRHLVQYELGDIPLTINPAGLWTIGGPTADCGVTGRKIVCDQYGPYCPVGGGAFSGKDPSKVDRSATYMARYLAKYALGIVPNAYECQVQLSYTIGQAEPYSLNVDFKDKALEEIEDEIKQKIINKFDLTPSGIIDFLKLKSRSFEAMAEGYHLSWV